MIFCVDCGSYAPCPHHPFPDDAAADNRTLDEARADLRAKAENGGAACPCCQQFAKVYRRNLNSSMARGLLTIRRYFQSHTDQEWLHIPSYFSKMRVCSSNDGSLLRHWQLIEPKPNGVRPDGSWRIGWYRMTKLGRDFSELRCRVRKYVFLYNQELLDRWDPETTDIVEALGKRFNYTELMSQ
jgi:hypothetical protein